MVQPIDPVLNVPSVPDLQIPSIPYKKLPFPFDDFTTLTQPDTGLTYPDSIPPTIATLAAMPHDGSQAGYLTHTNRALDVNVVDGGSGGSVSPLPSLANGNSGVNIVAGGEELFDFQGYEYITGISVSCSIYDFTEIPDSTTHINTVDFSFYNGWKFHTLPLGGYWSGGVFMGTASAHEFINLNYPTVLSGNDPDHSYPIAIQVHNYNLFAVLASVCLVGKVL